jgi:hypothetical protein
MIEEKEMIPLPYDKSKIHRERALYEKQLGPYGKIAMELSIRKQTEKRQNYSLTMISAISYDRIIANQIIEGGVDSVIFENYIYNMIVGLLNDPNM